MADKSGMSPRKQMAAGMADSGAGGIPAYPGHAHRVHPDIAAGTGEQGAQDDGDRAIGEPITHAKGHQPAQAAPHHGPHFENEMGFDRNPSKGY